MFDLCVRKVEPPLDPRQTFVNAIHAQRLPGELCLEIPDLRQNLPDARFHCRHAHLDVSEFGMRALDCPPYRAEMFQDQVLRFFGHASAYHTASAPEMISMSSLVIWAWRDRL
jgi:hypothetical protein